MLHSMAHWQKTVNGYSGIRPPLHEELYDQLRTFPSEDSVRHLAQLNVTYVIVHSSWFPAEQRRLLEERLLAFGSSLKLEYMDQDSRVYSIPRPRATRDRGEWRPTASRGCASPGCRRRVDCRCSSSTSEVRLHTLDHPVRDDKRPKITGRL
jgi:hypothetical protein